MATDPIILEDAKEYLQSGGLAFPNIAVLGCSGLLGSYLLDFASAVNMLLGVDSSVYGFSRSTTPHLASLKSRPGIFLHNIEELSSQLMPLSEIHIIHAASPASIKKIRMSTESLLESNVTLTERIFRILEKVQGSLTYFSSGEVYGDAPSIPTTEESYSGFDHLTPRGYYPEIKRFTELLSKIWSDSTEIPVSVLRIFHTFGPGVDASDDRIFSEAIHSLVNGKDIVLRSNGLAKRSFLYTSDLAWAIRTSISSSGFKVLNVGGTSEISILEFAKLVSTNRPSCNVILAETSFDRVTSESPILRGLGDISRLGEIGWRPRVSLETGIAKTIRSLEWRKSQGWQ
jgi:UDP-glucuronate decarboxylase